MTPSGQRDGDYCESKSKSLPGLLTDGSSVPLPVWLRRREARAGPLSDCSLSVKTEWLFNIRSTNEGICAQSLECSCTALVRYVRCNCCDRNQPHSCAVVVEFKIECRNLFRSTSIQNSNRAVFLPWFLLGPRLSFLSKVNLPLLFRFADFRIETDLPLSRNISQ